MRKARPATPVKTNERSRAAVEEVLLTAIGEHLARARSGSATPAAIAPTTSGLLTIAALVAADQINRVRATDRQIALPEVPKAARVHAPPVVFADVDLAPAQELADDLTSWVSERVSSQVTDYDDSWSMHAARSSATRLMSDAQELGAKTVAHYQGPDAEELVPGAIVPELDALDPDEWRKIWISHGDSRVRPLHRRLHGVSTTPGVPYWRWPHRGQTLMRPGDPKAPIEQFIGCRCTEFFCPDDVDPSAIVTAFAPADEDLSFKLVASAAPGRDRRGLIQFIHERVEAAARAAHPSNPESDVDDG